ncbi:iron-siderophore ABC transporter substrate-binding protein [Paenibacillus sp. N4]|uniref:ABC transporter substrate-binding protein n=1 Tax=Paenibacillus vietnamensis TaxID=2590547 RepID=UPI001CD0F905|nr:iron-siderophore ABC transporter substrate-binding protein [Paenibacillus vietnamensis]MCA0758592.1 iron-siderophore ABC transporter substrate-binding protein [Paenibacillus vietnamensis]
MKRMKFISFMLVAMVVFLAACGGTNNGGNNAGSENQGAEQTNNAGEATNAADPNATRTIKHAIGETEVTGEVKKVVVLEWTYAEDLLALGIQPAGVADTEGYKVWYGSLEQQLDGSAVDVGTRQEPSIETITSIDPDLIIGVKFRHEAIYDQLSDIAPTLIFNPYPEEGQGDQYSEMEETFKAIAAAVGKQAEGDKVLADLQAAFEDNKAKLAAAGKENHEVVMTQAWSTDGVPTFRLFTDNSMAMSILSKIGLKNAHKDEAFQVYGYSETSLEGLTKAQQASVLYTISPEDTIFSELLPKNDVYKELQFVKENRLYDLDGIWPFGGPLSAEQLATKVTELLTK